MTSRRRWDWVPVQQNNCRTSAVERILSVFQTLSTSPGSTNAVLQPRSPCCTPPSPPPPNTHAYMYTVSTLNAFTPCHATSPLTLNRRQQQQPCWQWTSCRHHLCIPAQHVWDPCRHSSYSSSSTTTSTSAICCEPWCCGSRTGDLQQQQQLPLQVRQGSLSCSSKASACCADPATSLWARVLCGVHWHVACGACDMPHLPLVFP